MIKKIIASVGLGFAGFLAYRAYTQDKGISADGEGGFMASALGTVQDGFMTVSGGSLGMQISLTGLAHIKGWEGFKANVYLDSAGKHTIGYGHLIKPTESFTTITIQQATALLMSDLQTAEAAVNRLVKVRLNQYQYDALVSFVFNVGAGNFAQSSLLKFVNSGNFTEVKKQFGRWIYAGGKVVTGLINRRLADAKLWGGEASA